MKKNVALTLISFAVLKLDECLSVQITSINVDETNPNHLEPGLRDPGSFLDP